MDIYLILSSKPHNPHYLKRYIRFIKQCQQKNVDYSGYVEKHHICPKADDMFPEYINFNLNSWNCAILTARQHFIAHLMLWKLFPRFSSQLKALNYMSNIKFLDKTVYTFPKLYQKYKQDLSEHLKTKIRAKDVATGKVFTVSRDDPRWVSGDLVGVTKGLCVVEDTCGNKFMTDPANINNINIKSIHKNKVAVKDSKGNVYKIDKSNEDYINGVLLPENKGFILVKDTEGNIFKVAKDDIRFKTGEIFGVAKGKVNVIDKNGKKFQVSKNDKRFHTGEINPIIADKISITNGELNKMICQNEVIPFGWRKGITKKSQKGMICITDGTHNSRIYPNEEIPFGWRKGVTRK